jgi:hypothetical protein
MPCSDRACRTENELIDGSLGTIFFVYAPGNSGPRDRLMKIRAATWGLAFPPFVPPAPTSARNTSPCTAGNSRNYTGRPRSDKASRRSEASKRSSGAGDSIAHSTWSAPGDSSAGSARISTLPHATHWCSSGLCSAGNAEDTFRTALGYAQPSSADATRVHLVCHISDRKVALAWSIITNLSVCG